MSRLVFFGCSFTSGHELSDHHNLNMSFADCNKLKKTFAYIGDFDQYVVNKTGLSKEQIYDIDRTYAWPKKLCDRLGITHKNLAVPGGSVEYSHAMFLLHHNQGLLNPQEDILIMGLTTQARIFCFNKLNPNRFYNIVLSSVNKQSQSLLDIYTDYKILYTYYRDLHTFMRDAESKGYTIKFQPVIDPEYLDVSKEIFRVHFDVKKDWDFWPVLIEKWSEIKNNVIDINLSLFEYRYKKNDPRLKIEPCGFDHPGELCHKIFADKLYDVMKDQNWWK